MNSKKKTVDEIYFFIRDHRHIILKFFSGARPLSRESKTFPYFVNVMLQQEGVYNFLNYVLCFIFGVEGQFDINEDASIIDVLRLTAYFLRTSVPSFIINEKNTNVLHICSRILHRYTNGKVPFSMFKKLYLKYTKAYLYTSLKKRIDTIPSVERKSYFIKTHIYHKRMLGTVKNHLLTIRFELSQNENQLRRIIYPDVNFAFNVALIDIINNVIVNVNTLDLYPLLNIIKAYIFSEKENIDYTLPTNQRIGRLTDANVIVLYESILSTLISRFKTKLIEVNEVGCFCNMKCIGFMIGGKGNILENYFHEVIMKTQLSLMICGKCRLSFSVDNTASSKPKLSYVCTNPNVATCSSCGSASVKNIPLYLVNHQGNKIIYSHRFYGTNTTSILDIIYSDISVNKNHEISRSSCKIYGVCFGGSRKCFNRYTQIVQYSDMKKDSTNKINLELFKCSDCQTVKQFDQHNHTYIKEKIHERTCLEHVIQEIQKGVSPDLLVNYMCSHCKICIMCRHTLNGLINNGILNIKTNRNVYLLVKLLKQVNAIIVIQKWLKENYFKE